MSSDEIWYFVRGKESVGPLSKSMIQKIYDAGQVLPETLVWREGMENWLPAKSVPELELQKPTPYGEEDTSGSRLKLKQNAPPPKREPAFEMPAPIAAPAPKAPSTPPLTKSRNYQAETPSGNLKVKDTSPSFLKATYHKIFSSTFMTPLFLLAAGGMIFFYKSNFPNVYWFSYLAFGFAVFGLLFLVGVHGMDQIFQILSFLFLAPPIGVLWPVIMGEFPWQKVPPAHWTFLGLGFLICITTRIGLRIYMSSFLGRFAAVTGLTTLVLIGVIGTKTWTPKGWEVLVIQKANPRLPAKLAKAIGKPEWGVGAGWLKLIENNVESEHRIESAILKHSGATDWRLSIKTMDDLLLIIKITGDGNTLDLQKILNQPWPIYFTKESADDTETFIPTWSLANGTKADISNATFTVIKINSDNWEGNMTFQLRGIDIPITGTYFIQVTEVQPAS